MTKTIFRLALLAPLLLAGCATTAPAPRADAAVAAYRESVEYTQDVEFSLLGKVGAVGEYREGDVHSSK